MNLDFPISNLSFIRKPHKDKLKKLGILTIRDLVFLLPTRYQDFSVITPISKTRFGESVCVKGEILKIQNNWFVKKMQITNATIKDKTGTLQVTWFGQPYITKAIKKGDTVLLAGKISENRKSKYLSNPAHEIIGDKLIHTGGIIPMYPHSTKVASRWFRKTIKRILTDLTDIPEYLPKEILAKHKFLDLKTALNQVHFPTSNKEKEKALERFSFDELFILELAVIQNKIKAAGEPSVQLEIKLPAIKDFISQLKFTLTDDQKKSAWRILTDTELDKPMFRLLEGDVGSGKTVVAAIASLNVIKNGYQTSFMAPTEILAIQHFKTLSTVFTGFNINVGLLTGKKDLYISKKLAGQPIEVSRKKLIEKTAKGEIDILVGTHALIQGKVKFKDLAFLVIDEQHRFGVKQRANLIKENQKYVPHLLSMTATPIPRSLALTVYGDLDLTIIKSMPKNRKTIITEVIKENKRDKAYDFIAKEIKKGRQAFVVCPKIEKKELEEGQEITMWHNVKSVTETHADLQENIFPDLKIALLHGKLKSKEKEDIMEDFKNKKYDILVSTSVIEVGIDVPNASVMMIEGSERFGLAQLHQLRGRVGRSHYQSYCFLFLSPGTPYSQRAVALTKAKTGFEVSQKDLEIRGPGELFGTKQSGIPDLIMKSLGNIKLVEKTRELAKEILLKDPNLKKQPELIKQVTSLRKKIHLE